MEEALDNIVYLHMAHTSLRLVVACVVEELDRGNTEKAKSLLRLL